MPDGSTHNGHDLPAPLLELDRRIAAAVEGQLASLREQIENRLRTSGNDLLKAAEDLQLELPSQYLSAADIATFAATPSAAGAGSEAILASVARIDRARTQPDLISVLLEEARRYSSRSAFFLTRPDGIHGWSSRGFGSLDRPLDEVVLPYESDTVWSTLAQGQGPVTLGATSCARLAERLGTTIGTQGALVPFVLRGHLAGALYADLLADNDGESFDAAALQLLVHSAALSLETLALRQDAGSPTLRGASADRDTDADAIGLWDSTAGAAATAGAVGADVPVDELGDELGGDPELEPVEPSVDAPAVTASDDFDFEVSEPETLELEPLDASIFETDGSGQLEADAETRSEVASAPTAEAAAAEPPALEVWEDEDPTVETRFRGTDVTAETATDSQLEDTRATDTPDFELDYRDPEVTTEAVPPVSPVPDAAALDPNEDATIVASRGAMITPRVEEDGLAEPVTPGGLDESGSLPAAPETKSKPRGSSQVVPPMDVDGPGLAFVSASKTADPATIPDGEEALHEEAKRLARLLVSEIKLYNEEVIEEGRRDGNIYARLKEDIDRSRQMYDERIDPRLRKGTDYFLDELVQRLAGGDASIMGL